MSVNHIRPNNTVDSHSLPLQIINPPSMYSPPLKKKRFYNLQEIKLLLTSAHLPLILFALSVGCLCFLCLCIIPTHTPIKALCDRQSPGTIRGSISFLQDAIYFCFSIYGNAQRQTPHFFYEVNKCKFLMYPSKYVHKAGWVEMPCSLYYQAAAAGLFPAVSQKKSEHI